MDSLLEKAVFFENEWKKTDDRDDNTIDLTTRNLRKVQALHNLWSMRTPEGHYELAQRRTGNDLECGARTLYVDTSGAIALRGLNKFYEIEEIGGLILRNRSFLKPLELQRKLAGFVVCIAEIKGELVISSKHSMEGYHVDLASKMLDRARPDRENLVKFLNDTNSVLVCEGVDLTNDSCHPVAEPQRFHGLTLLTALVKNSKTERTLPILDEASRVTGLPIVNTTPLTWDLLADTTKSCSTWTPSHMDETEGYVATFSEISTGRIFRVKIKTLRYKAQRAMRHVVSLLRENGEGRLVRMWSGLLSHQKALVAYGMVHCKEFLFTGDAKRVEITSLFKEFDAHLDPAHRAVWAKHLQGLRSPVPASAHTLLLSVGLPGCGKSTALTKIASDLSLTTHVVYLSRDAITEAERRKRNGKTDVTRHVHTQIATLVHAVLSHAQEPTVVIIDGCHLTNGARNILTQLFSRSTVANFKCSVATATERAKGRGEHPTLKGDVKAVIEMMGKRLVYEKEGTVLDIDTEELAVEQVVAAITEKITSQHCSSGFPQAVSPRLVQTGEILGVYSPGHLTSEGLLTALNLSPPPTTAVATLNYISITPQNTAWDTVVSRVLSSMARALGGTGSWTNTILELFQGSITVTPLSGQETPQWLKGGLNKLIFKDPTVTTLLEALYSMYGINTHMGSLHCTVAYAGGALPEDPATAEAVLEMMRDKEKLEGTECTVLCDQIICDNKGLCLGVKCITPGLPCSGSHVTLGVSDKATPRYCNELLVSIDEWERSNTEVAEIRSAKRARRDTKQEQPSMEDQLSEQLVNSSSVRKQRKQRFHNCVRLALDPPITLKGNLTYNMLP